MKIIDYTTIIRSRASDVEQGVKSLLQFGWQPQGGISEGSEGDYIQAMVQYAEEDDEPELDLDTIDFQAFPKIPELNFDTAPDTDEPKLERDYRGDLFKGAQFDQWGIGVHAPDDAEVSVTIVRRVRNGQEADRWVEDVKLFLQAEQESLE